MRNRRVNHKNSIIKEREKKTGETKRCGWTLFQQTHFCRLHLCGFWGPINQRVGKENVGRIVFFRRIISRSVSFLFFSCFFSPDLLIISSLRSFTIHVANYYEKPSVWLPRPGLLAVIQNGDQFILQWSNVCISSRKIFIIMTLTYSKSPVLSFAKALGGIDAKILKRTV